MSIAETQERRALQRTVDALLVQMEALAKRVTELEQIVTAPEPEKQRASAKR